MNNRNIIKLYSLVLIQLFLFNSLNAAAPAPASAMAPQGMPIYYVMPTPGSASSQGTLSNIASNIENTTKIAFYVAGLTVLGGGGYMAYKWIKGNKQTNESLGAIASEQQNQGKTLTTIKSKQSVHGHRLHDIQSTQNRHTKALDTIEKNQKEHTEGIKDVKGALKKQDGFWSKFFDWQGNMDSTAAAQGKVLATIQTEVASLAKELTGVKTAVTRVEGALKDVNTHVKEMDARTKEIGKTLALSATKIATIQEGQEKDRKAQVEEHEKTRAAFRVAIDDLRKEFRTGHGQIMMSQRATLQKLSGTGSISPEFQAGLTQAITGAARPATAVSPSSSSSKPLVSAKDPKFGVPSAHSQVNTVKQS